jgi:hypothetical protein
MAAGRAGGSCLSAATGEVARLRAGGAGPRLRPGRPRPAGRAAHRRHAPLARRERSERRSAGIPSPPRMPHERRMATLGRGGVTTGTCPPAPGGA